MQQYRPKLDIPLTKRDKSLEVAGFLVMIAVWIISIIAYIKAPDVIPIHYNSDGAADGYGSKATLFIEPAISTFVYLLLSAISRIPHQFNYLVTITPENAEDQYRRALTMLRILKICIPLAMVVLLLNTAFTNDQQLGIGMILTEVFFVLLLPLFIIIYTTARKKQPKKQ